MLDPTVEAAVWARVRAATAGNRSCQPIRQKAAGAGEKVALLALAGLLLRRR